MGVARNDIMYIPPLQSHPEVIEAARTALKQYGAGLSSVRFICGTQVYIHTYIHIYI